MSDRETEDLHRATDRARQAQRDLKMKVRRPEWMRDFEAKEPRRPLWAERQGNQ